MERDSQMQRHEEVMDLLRTQTDERLTRIGIFFPDLKTLCEIVKTEREDRETKTV